MASLAIILSEHPELKLLANNRIKCDVTGHELPPNAAAVVAHINGKKYKKALEWYNQDYSKYLPYIVAHRSDPTKLFCNVTKQEINKIPTQVQKHVSGKRYQRLKDEFDSLQQRKQKKSSDKSHEKESDEEEETDFWIPDGFDDEEQANEEGSMISDDGEEPLPDDERPPTKSNRKGTNGKRKRNESDDVIIYRKKDGKSAKRSKESI